MFYIWMFIGAVIGYITAVLCINSKLNDQEENQKERE